MFDFDAYVARIGLPGDASIAELHRAHVFSIPFENLDPQRGVPVSLDEPALVRKLVTERRGGYCFEQNLLLKAGLEALGAEVEPLLARVRSGAPPGVVRPRSHLVLRVRTGHETLLADVGFGLGTLLEPIPLDAGGMHEQLGWRYRLIQDGREELVLQSETENGWEDLYGFVPEAVPRVDIETSNWFTSTYPRSPFVTGLTVAIQRPDGMRVSLSDWNGLALTVQTPSGSTVTPTRRQDVPALLANRFSLPGFTLGGDGRLVPVHRA